MKGGVKKSQSRKTLPGYMLVQMELSDETGHLVRNTPKITGFVGGSRKPPALRDAEVARMRAPSGSAPKPRIKVEFNQGDQVKVTEGPFANFNGSIEEVKADKQKVKVLVSIFGRSTAVELDFSQVEKTG
jgi:transcriptional antiterminator NusG